MFSLPVLAGVLGIALGVALAVAIGLRSKLQEAERGLASEKNQHAAKVQDLNEQATCMHSLLVALGVWNTWQGFDFTRKVLSCQDQTKSSAGALKGMSVKERAQAQINALCLEILPKWEAIGFRAYGHATKTLAAAIEQLAMAEHLGSNAEISVVIDSSADAGKVSMIRSTKETLVRFVDIDGRMTDVPQHNFFGAFRITPTRGTIAHEPAKHRPTLVIYARIWEADTRGY